MTEENNEALPSRELGLPDRSEPDPALPVDETNSEIIEEVQRILGEDYEDDPKTLRVISRVVAEYYKGPLPPPAMLHGYENVLPGCADRIVALMEQQSAHRRELEKTTIGADIRSRYIGQISALFLCLLVIVGGFAAVLTGQSVAGIAAILIAAGGVAATFLGTSRRQQQELEEKRAALPEE